MGYPLLWDAAGRTQVWTQRAAEQRAFIKLRVPALSGFSPASLPGLLFMSVP